jgi:hypothetical protein
VLVAETAADVQTGKSQQNMCLGKLTRNIKELLFAESVMIVPTVGPGCRRFEGVVGEGMTAC